VLAILASAIIRTMATATRPLPPGVLERLPLKKGPGHTRTRPLDVSRYGLLGGVESTSLCLAEGVPKTPTTWPV
jgi:hypothetical protein